MAAIQFDWKIELPTLNQSLNLFGFDRRYFQIKDKDKKHFIEILIAQLLKNEIILELFFKVSCNALSLVIRLHCIQNEMISCLKFLIQKKFAC